MFRRPLFALAIIMLTLSLAPPLASAGIAYTDEGKKILALPLKVTTQPDPDYAFKQETAVRARSAIVSTMGYWSWQDYPFPVPTVEPVVVPVFVNQEFANSGYNPVTVQVEVPEGEWSKILLRIDAKLYDPVYGRPVQYDRPIWIFVNGVPVIWGSTAQRFNWTVTADVTLFYSLFKGKINVTMILPNWVVPQIGVTGRFLVNVTLLLYPGMKPDVPDLIVPLWMDSWIKGIAAAVPNYASPNITAPIEVPTNVVKAKLLLYTEGLAWDEFWYYYGKCYREIKVFFDDKLIALIHPYHYIYTGGLFPLLWRPLPAVRVYATEPVIIDVTGLLPLIVGKHNVTVQVTNIYSRSRWVIGGALLLWTTDKPVEMELVSYECTPPATSVSTEEVNGVTTYRVETSFTLTGTSRIKVGEETILATSTLVSTLTLERSYTDEWDNVTLVEYRLSTLVYNSPVSGSVVWSSEWIAPLKVDYGFVITPYGDISQASVENPVPADFKLIINVIQGLDEIVRTISVDDGGVSTKRLTEVVAGRNIVAGRLMFISPTGAVVTGITMVYASTIKGCHGLVYETPVKGKSYLWSYTRSTLARTTMERWYVVVVDNLYVTEK